MAGVTSSYPAALDSESNLTPPNNGDTLSVADHWLAGNSGPIVAIETELGTDPAGYATDVKTRLNTINPSSGLLAADGLQFPGTQVASADANTLDDYEEGTWTPSVGGTATYNYQAGIYTKVGNIVHIQFRIHIDTLGTGSAFLMSGLPFTSPDDLSGVNVQTGCVSYFSNLAVSVVYLEFYVVNNATTIHFTDLTSAGITTSAPTNVFGTNTAIYGSVSYRIA